MKKTIIIVGAIIVIVMSYIAGVMTGNYYMGRFIDELVKPYASVDRYAVEIMDDYITAYMMYQNKNKEALDIVNSRIDATIIILDDKMNREDNDRSRESAINAIKRVKEMRSKNEYVSDNEDIQRKLEEIFSKYATEN